MYYNDLYTATEGYLRKPKIHKKKTVKRKDSIKSYPEIPKSSQLKTS